MKRIIIHGAFVFACFVSCNHPGDTTLNRDNTIKNTVPEQQVKVNKAVTHVITISNMKFQPEEVIVKSGDTVVWINRDFVTHCITEEKDKKWTSSMLKKDSSWKMVALMSEDYFCALHQVMKGKIVVAGMQPDQK